jgi:hypothetical protein
MNNARFKNTGYMMKKKMMFPVVLIVMVLLVSACSSGGSTAATQTAGAQTTTGVNSDTPLSSRLAIGILQLEDTNLAVTPEQAKTLLPLWKAVKSMSSSDTATEAEIQAIYDQIQEVMNADQIAAIEAMEMTQEEMTSLMSKLGIEVGPFGGGGMANLTEDQRATQIAQFQAQGGVLPDSGERPSFQFPGGQPPSGAGGDGGMPSGGGMPFGGGGNFAPDGMDPGMLTIDGTQTAGSGNSGRRAFGMNQIFIEPLIKLLTERSAS